VVEDALLEQDLRIDRYSQPTRELERIAVLTPNRPVGGAILAVLWIHKDGSIGVEDRHDGDRVREAIRRAGLGSRIVEPASINVPKKIDRIDLGELMSPWGTDSTYGEGSGAMSAVSSYYMVDRSYPDRFMVKRALEQAESDIPLADRGLLGWTKKDAVELRQNAAGLLYYLEVDYR
jgi:hypothetical protein